MQRVIVAIALIAVATGGTPPAHAKLRVVTTTTDLGWFAREVGGDRVDVSVITRGYQDPHFLEPKPSYIVKLSRADALLFIGLEIEVGWLPKLLDGAHNPDIQVGQPGLYSPSGEVRVLEKPSGPLDRAAGDVHPFGNPHYWLSPANAGAIARGLAERLAELDPDGASGFEARADALVAEIARRDTDWKKRLAPARGMKLVTYHKTYSYFIDHFGLVAVDFVEPKPGVPPSSRHLAQLIRKVKAEDVKLLLIENFFEPRNGRFVADRTGVPMIVAPVSVGGEDGIDSWFDLIEVLVTAIEQANGG